jgi:hypothetical protein
MAERRAAGSGLAHAAAASALLGITVMLATPAAIYFGNRTEFIESFGELVPWLVAVTFLTATALTAAVMVLRPGASRMAAATVLLIASLALWAQSHAIVQQPRLLSGDPIDWSGFAVQAWTDRALWAVAAGLAFTLIRLRWHWPIWLAIAGCGIQVGAVGVQAAISPARWVDRTAFDESSRYALSSRSNVIVLVLDTFQSDLFQELLDEEPGLGATFSGFTYFRNATAGFPSTAPSIPFILTGQLYDNRQPFDVFVRDAFLDGSLPQALKAAGHHVYYNSAYLWPAMYADERTSSHASTAPGSRYRLASWNRAAMLLALAAFRAAPQDVKRRMERQVVEMATRGAAAWGDDRAFFDEFERAATASLDVPAFKYYHLQGLHPPLRYDAALHSSARPATRAHTLDQARGLMRMLTRMVATLQARGLYDRTALVVLADHGAAIEPRLGDVDPGARTVPGATALPTRHSFGLPLMLAKPFDRTGTLLVSDAPVSIGDLGATVGHWLALETRFPGVALFDQPAGPRARRVLRYDPNLLDLNANHFPPLSEYLVSGFSWLGESWTATGRTFTPGTVTTSKAAAATPRRSLTFGRLGDSLPAQDEGWAAPEDGITWTDGWMSALTLALPPCPESVRLQARLLPALLGGTTRQRVEVLDGDRLAGIWEVASAGEFSVRLDGAAPGRAARVRFLLPDAVVPAAIEPALGDTRRLGVAFSSIELTCEGSR